MTRPVRRYASALLLGVLALVGWAGTARADSNAAITNLSHGEDGTVTGLLTVKADADSAKLDPGSLRLEVDGKQYTATPAQRPRVDRSAILLIDRSGSMRESGMQVVRGAVAQFLATVPSDVRVGVVSFADDVTVNAPPTTDHKAVQAAVDGLRSGGDTRLYDGVAQAVATLGATGDRSILLLSDGRNSTGATSQQAAEQQLRAGGVRMQVIAFRTVQTDDLALGYLASAGQGTVTSVDNAVGVARTFTAVARSLDTQVSWTAQTSADLRGDQAVTLRGAADGAPFAATSTLSFGAVPPPPTPSGTPSPSASLSAPVATPQQLPGSVGAEGPLFTSTVAGAPVAVVVGAAAVFAALLLVVLALMTPSLKSRRRERVEAIDLYVSPPPARAERAPRTTTITGLTEQLAHIGDRVMEGRETTKTVMLLQRADVPWRIGEWAVLRVVAVLAGIGAGVGLLHGDGDVTVLGLLVGALAGILAPPAILRWRAGRRAHKFERQLPDVLNLIASSLSTGFSLPQALDAVARDVAQPASKEFARAMAETRIGSDIEDALSRMADRMDSQNMRWAAMAIQIQRRVGGNLAETLRTTAATLRERESLFRQVRALSAEGRLSAWILVGLPIVLFLWMFYVNGAYISLLWQNPFGIVLAVLGALLMVVGVFWMRKVVEVEV